MSRKTAFTVHVRKTEPINPKRPELGDSIVKEETFLAGSVLPAWAQALVGDHVYGDNEDDGQKPDDFDADGDGPQPAGNASLEAWREYATSQGVDVEGLSRDELRGRFTS